MDTILAQNEVQTNPVAGIFKNVRNILYYFRKISYLSQTEIAQFKSQIHPETIAQKKMA